MKPYMAMIKVLTGLKLYNTKRRHKQGVYSNNTSSDCALKISFSISPKTSFYRYFANGECPENIGGIIWQRPSSYRQYRRNSVTPVLAKL